MNLTPVACPISSDKPDIKFYDQSSMKEIPIEIVKLENGHISNIFTKKGEGTYEEVPLKDVFIYQNFLEVPGVGFLYPGTKVCLDDDKYDRTYVLLQDWHTNASNQRIFGWFLRPTDLVIKEDPSNYMSQLPPDFLTDRTLYEWMINHLCRITP